MSAAQNPIALDDVCFVARRILAMIKDPRTNAERLGRVIDSVEPLSLMAQQAANDLFGERGRVCTASQAITVLGFNRLEALTRRFLYTEITRLASLDAQETPADAFERAVSTPMPMEAPEIIRVAEVRASIRYAAIA